MLNNDPARQAILTTILYSDIFSFPLTKDELWEFLISDKKISHAEFEKNLETRQKYLIQKDGYYCLKNREKIIADRISNLQEVAKKRKKAQLIAEKLARIPSILFIGISGGLASGNISASDDIDFVIIVKKDTLFITRFLVLGTLELLGVRRHRNQKNTADAICVNLLLDETVLAWFQSTQDVYTAREIAQIIPVFEREDMYRNFMIANTWIRRFLPNVIFKSKDMVLIHTNVFLQCIFWIVSNPFCETILRSLQMSYMKRHQTREVITKHILAFHPNDYRTLTLTQLRLKMRQLGLLTKF